MIFIGGAPRTGKTLIKNIICSDNETIPNLRESSYLKSLLSSYNVGKIMWNYHTYEYFDSPSHFMQFNKFILDNYFEQLYNKFGKGKIIVQENHGLTSLFPDLEELYPKQCKFIVMLRDPRDAIASFKKLQPTYSVEAFFNQYIETYKELMMWLKNKKMENLIWIKYENLIQHKVKTIEEINKYLGLSISHSTNICSFKNSTEFCEEIETNHIQTSNIKEYMNVLNENEINYIESHKDRIESLLNKNVFIR